MRRVRRLPAACRGWKRRGSLSSYTSTQENAWLVLAARAIAKDAAGVSMTVNGEAQKGALYRSLNAAAFQNNPLRIANGGEETLQAVVSVTGAPLVPEPAAERGFKIERTYYTLDGEPADITKAKQNERFAVVLKITEQQPQFGRIIVADYLPAGLEIDNPRLVSSGETGTLSWIELAQTPVECGIPRRPLHRGLQPQERGCGDLHRRLCRARGVAGHLCASAGLRRGHVSSRPLRPHRFRHADGVGGEMRARRDLRCADRHGADLRRARALRSGWRRCRRCRSSRRSIIRPKCWIGKGGCFAPMRPRRAAGGCGRGSRMSIRAISTC